jgi:hypothetical protein
MPAQKKKNNMCPIAYRTHVSDSNSNILEFITGV